MLHFHYFNIGKANRRYTDGADLRVTICVYLCGVLVQKSPTFAKLCSKYAFGRADNNYKMGESFFFGP